MRQILKNNATYRWLRARYHKHWLHADRSKRFLHAKIAKSAIIKGRHRISFGSKVEIGDFVILQSERDRIFIGSNSQINPFTVIIAYGGVTIGANVMVAPHCMIVASNHDFVQTKIPMRFAEPISAGPIVIEDDVWIGAHSTITDGVRIGTGAVVAANSVVTRDVAPFDIVAGVPARKIGNRLTWKKADADPAPKPSA